MLKINIVSKIINFTLDVIFPDKCVGCGIKNEFLCMECLSKIKISDRENIENAFSVFSYQDPIIKKAIWKIKYHHRKNLAHKLGQILYEFNKDIIYEMQAFCPGQKVFVVPVPIHKDKRRIRGYNQAEEIAKGFCSQDKDNIFELRENIIFKNKNGIAQATIKDRNVRLRNIKNSFYCSSIKEIKGRTFLIIDDVITTGGTINEIKRELKKYKPKKIYSFSIAH